MKFNRIGVIVLDSLGVGHAPDANNYNDNGANTLKTITTPRKLDIPNLTKMGLGLYDSNNVDKPTKPLAYIASLSEQSNGKDTLTGHWEMMGIKTEEPFVTFTETGFPKELIEMIEKFSGREVVGNKSASGTEILDELAMEEIHNNKLIVYTSSDSVLQVCGNENHMGLEELYRICEYAREICLKPEWKVGRIIARAYVGEKPGEFKRTANRKDYAVSPSNENTLFKLKESSLSVKAVGKISDIFNGSGVTEEFHGKNDKDNMDITIQEFKKSDWKGLVFTNLVDFDALYGHRRNIEGYASNLELFDKSFGELLETLKEDDLIILTSDHGNDPGFSGSDHTRECAMFIAYSPAFKDAKALGTLESFATIGAIIEENFGLEVNKLGVKLLETLK